MVIRVVRIVSRDLNITATQICHNNRYHHDPLRNINVENASRLYLSEWTEHAGASSSVDCLPCMWRSMFLLGSQCRPACGKLNVPNAERGIMLASRFTSLLWVKEGCSPSWMVGLSWRMGAMIMGSQIFYISAFNVQTHFVRWANCYSTKIRRTIIRECSDVDSSHGRVTTHLGFSSVNIYVMQTQS